MGGQWNSRCTEPRLPGKENWCCHHQQPTVLPPYPACCVYWSGRSADFIPGAPSKFMNMIIVPVSFLMPNPHMLIFASTVTSQRNYEDHLWDHVPSLRWAPFDSVGESGPLGGQSRSDKTQMLIIIAFILSKQFQHICRTILACHRLLHKQW